MKVSGRSYKNSTARRIKALREKSRVMNRARWSRHRAEIDRKIATGEMPLPERGVQPGDLRGVLQWTGADGKVRRWTVRHASRVNSIRIDGVAEHETE